MSVTNIAEPVTEAEIDQLCVLSARAIGLHDLEPCY